MPPVAPVALITGGSSGIGLALTKHLLSKCWHVLIADINAPPTHQLSMYPPSSHHFHHTDVSCWSSQLSCFETCWTIFGRLDFCALNAGIDDRDDIFNSVGAGVGGGELPKKPDMTTFEVNLFGPYYGVKLAAHYMAKNTLLLDKNSAADKGIVVVGGGGKIIITASDAGLWALPPVPQYTATKHGIIGLVRALAPSALTAANISINAVAPALTPSNLAPPGLLDHYPQEALTKMETLMMAFDALGLFDRVGERGWGAMGPNGQVVEGRGDDIYFKEELEKVGGKEVSREIKLIWEETYKERNKRFALQNQMKGT